MASAHQVLDERPGARIAIPVFVHTLDERVDRNKVDAKMDQGILTVTLHLKEEVKPRKIKVKTV